MLVERVALGVTADTQIKRRVVSINNELLAASSAEEMFSTASPLGSEGGKMLDDCLVCISILERVHLNRYLEHTSR